VNYQSNCRRFNQVQPGCKCVEYNSCTHQKTALPDCPVVAMAYIPFQTDTTVYDECKALKVGTLFPVLNLPFTGVCGVKHG